MSRRKQKPKEMPNNTQKPSPTNTSLGTDQKDKISEESKEPVSNPIALLMAKKSNRHKKPKDSLSQRYQNSQGGFLVVLFLSILPLCITLLTAAFTLAFYFEFQNHTRYLCQKQLIHIQQQNAKALKELTKLNPKARKLRRQVKRTRKQIAKAIIIAPQVVPALKAKLALLKAQQLQLAIKQNIIIKNTKHITKTQLTRLKKRINKSVEIELPQAKLAVYRTPMLSLSPDYKTKKPLAKFQGMKVSWKLNQHHLYPAWILRVFKDLPVISGNCSATIQERSHKWNVQLGLG